MRVKTRERELSLPFHDFLIEQLKDPELAVAYLNEHMSYRGPGFQEHILQALRNIAEAHGITQAAKKSKIPRRTLYHALSKRGNPTLETVMQFLRFAGIQLSFQVATAHPGARVRKRA